MEQQLSIIAREVAYSDMDFALRANPITGDIARKKDVEAIKQSVLNILLTNRGERPFQPTFGSDITGQLFENFDPIVAALIEEKVRFALINFEPRIKVLNVRVEDRSDRNSIGVTVEIEIVSPERVTTEIDFTVERLR